VTIPLNPFYTESQALTFIEKTFGDASVTQDGKNASVVCPRCRETDKKTGKVTVKQKLAIRTDNFASHCWICGIKGRNLLPILRRYHPQAANEFLVKFHKEIETSRAYVATTDLTAKELFLPEGFMLLVEHLDNPHPQVQAALAYLESRGLAYRDLWYYKFGVIPGHAKMNRRVVMPSFDEQGRLNYYTGRSFVPTTFRRYMDCDEQTDGSSPTKLNTIFNENRIDWTKELTLVEGPFDLVKCDDNVTCMLGSNFSEDSLLFSRILEFGTPILLALDSDMQIKTDKLARMFSQFGIVVRVLQLPQGVKDVGELSREVFIELKNSAPKWSSELSLKNKIAQIFAR
jgi:hypothetical protein